MYYAVIMAGGSGTRLWPLSRRDYPKQALKLVGEKTMFQYAVERIRSIFPPERIMVVTLAKHAPILMGQVPELPAENFILEPEGRGTAPAIGLAAIHLIRNDPDACMVILTADHFIKDTKHFCEVLAAAERVADGRLVTLGIQPSDPSTGFGYIHQGALAGEENGFPFYSVERFTEKPDLATARKMLESGAYTQAHWREVADILDARLRLGDGQGRCRGRRGISPPNRPRHHRGVDLFKPRTTRNSP